MSLLIFKLHSFILYYCLFIEPRPVELGQLRSEVFEDIVLEAFSDWGAKFIRPQACQGNFFWFLDIFVKWGLVLELRTGHSLACYELEDLGYCK